MNILIKTVTPDGKIDQSRKDEIELTITPCYQKRFAEEKKSFKHNLVNGIKIIEVPVEKKNQSLIINARGVSGTSQLKSQRLNFARIGFSH